MKTQFIATATILTIAGLVAPIKAENLNHTNQLLATKQCSSCDLSNAGLIRANLTGADLRGADLTRANLSRADLSGADLSWANLSGTSLNGANLMGANLVGADLRGADLRGAQLSGANLIGANIDTRYIQGAVGIPDHAGTPEQFQSWAVAEGQKGNYRAAIGYYNQALTIDPEYGQAYLGRGVARFYLGDLDGALQDGQAASQLFEEQENTTAQQASQQFVEGVELAMIPPEERLQARGGGVKQALMSVGSLLVQFLLRGGI